MPDLVTHSRLFRHDVHSAVASLSQLGVSLDEIVLRYREGDGFAGQIVGQSPEAGALLLSRRRVILDIAGTGMLFALPYKLRHDSDAAEMGSDILSAVLDTSLARARVFVQQGGGHFLLQPGVPITARRWIQDVMRLPIGDWPQEDWYRIARLLSALPQIAGRADAVRVGLGFVYGLPVETSHVTYERLPLERSIAARLGERNGRLGIDAVVGDGLVAAHALHVRIGPIPLATYLKHIGRLSQRTALYRLLMPAYLRGGVVERWVVERQEAGYRLGSRESPALLGVSSYLAPSTLQTLVAN